MVWRWSKGGDDAAIDRARTVSGWRFGPEKRLDRLEFYEESAEGSTKGGKKSATSAPSQAVLASIAANGVGGLSLGGAEGAVEKAEGAAAGSAASEAWRHGDGSYTLVGEGQGINGLPPMVYGTVWNPFPGMEEFITYGAKHIKVWRKVKVGTESRWVGEMGLRNDGLRIADCAQANAGDPNTGEGKISAAAALANASKSSSRPGSAVSSSAKNTGGRILSKSMTPLSKLSAKGKQGKPPSRPSSAVRKSMNSIPKAATPGVGETGEQGNQVTIGGENIVSAVYVRRDVIVTGFPSGALGVWTVQHFGVDGKKCHPRDDDVARWTVSMAQRIANAHGTGPKVNLNDGTTTYGGIRAMTMRADGATLLTGGADGWVHTWQVKDGSIAVVGRPKTDGPGKPPVDKKRAVLLTKLGDKTQTQGPHSFRITSPYPNEPPPAFRAIDCRPQVRFFLFGVSFYFICMGN